MVEQLKLISPSDMKIRVECNKREPTISNKVTARGGVEAREVHISLSNSINLENQDPHIIL